MASGSPCCRPETGRQPRPAPGRDDEICELVTMALTKLEGVSALGTIGLPWSCGPTSSCRGEVGKIGGWGDSGPSAATPMAACATATGGIGDEHPKGPRGHRAVSRGGRCELSHPFRLKDHVLSGLVQ
jgi:hypothetical protein